MKHLRAHDIEELILKAGSGDGPVTVSREDFEALVDGYYVEFPHGSFICDKCLEENICTLERL